jgi:Spy/CpxP family protein refolding chaperone
MKRIAVLAMAVFFIFNTQLLSQPNDVRAMHRVMGKLNLTDAQKKDVEKIHFDAEKQTVAQRAKLATGRIELQQLLASENPEKPAIEKKINEMADVGAQLRIIKLNSWFAVNKLLTPDQQKIWKKVLENAPGMERQRMMNRMGRRPMRPQMHEPPRPE